MRRPRPRPRGREDARGDAARSGRIRTGGRGRGGTEPGRAEPGPPAPRTGPSPAPGDERIEALLADLEHALVAGRTELAGELRARILEAAPEGPAAAEAGLKLGLQRLLVARDADGAMSALRAAIRARGGRFSRSARVTLGQLLLRLDRPQQAAFELRKAAGEPPLDLEGVQALAFLAEALQRLGKGREADALADRRIEALGRLAESKGETGAIAAAWRGFELKHAGARREARAALEGALASPDLPPGEREAVTRALESL